MDSLKIKGIMVHQYGGPEVLQVETMDRPTPGDKEVLVRVHAAGVLPIEWKIRQGLFKQMRPTTFPYIPGSAIAGVIEEVGAHVTKFRKGQEVFGRSSNGAYAEYIITDVERLAVKLSGISFAEAATISGGATTAWQALFNNGNLHKDQRVLIHGAAGGVGSFAVQLAAWKGAHVIGTCSTANVERVKSLGAAEVIDYTSNRFEDFAEGMDLVLDTVGGETLERSYDVVKKGGMLLSIAGQPSQEKARDLGIRAEFSNALLTSETMEEIAQLMAAGSLKAVIGHTYPLHAASEAQLRSQTGHGQGRIVLEIQPSL
ncbi:NADP-dependent oxidoreductase [Paenibacillus planticolens]|uniref:Zinc-binding dehydrogenase n=1 Tax=Paenibacillus planticolens TaxID=2654976 RepID=A0ABX1ZKF9_9BACL|nr:NADP-dependent oxidoreductase [Paenibacillus planticolens]NOU99268.1 zinc-binding dehydrogenase [Paenibacillus planticolens]